MKVMNVDGLNTVLLILSAIAAFFLPFELFLFSYAFFGPLHYLTEISWLEKRDFFVSNKKYVWFLILVGCILFAMNLGFLFYGSLQSMFVFSALLLAASFSFALWFIKNWTRTQRVVIAILIGIVLVCTYSIQLWAVFFAILLPTIIHVSVFTVLFMLQGAQRNESFIGYFNVALYFVILFVLVLITVKGSAYSLSGYVTEAYRSFEGVNLEIMNLLNIGNFNIQWSIYESSAGLSIMRFIAFAYTYHYLNWFSKVKIINWHKISGSKMTFIILVWISAIILYLLNYQFGLFVLYFLSLMHVLLEFPLNQHSIIGIYSGFAKQKSNL